MLTRDGKPRAGSMKSSRPAAPTIWLPNVLVDRCDATLARAGQLGAGELVPATDIPNVGRFAMAADPTGAAIAFISRP